MSAPKTSPKPDPEIAQRRPAQLELLRHLVELNMQAAEIAATKISKCEPVSAENPNPNIDLARATRAVTQLISLEIRVLNGEPAKPAARATAAARPLVKSTDPRRPLLRQTLHKAAETEPDRNARNQLRRMIDDRIDEELGADPDLDCPIGDILLTVADDLGLRIDVAQLPDELLGLAPRPRAANDSPDRPLWAPAYTDPDPPT